MLLHLELKLDDLITYHSHSLLLYELTVCQLYHSYLLLEPVNVKTLRKICLQTVISSSASKSVEKCLCHTLVSQAQIIIEPFYYLKYVTYIHKLFYTNLSSLKTMANAQQKENLFYSSIYQMQKQTKAHLKL